MFVLFGKYKDLSMIMHGTENFKITGDGLE